MTKQNQSQKWLRGRNSLIILITPKAKSRILDKIKAAKMHFEIGSVMGYPKRWRWKNINYINKIMEKLSLKPYGWKCVLGAETAYVLCLIGGFLPLRSARGTELHHAFFETLPGFTWITFGSVILGAVYVFVFALAFASYFVWMHNSSLRPFVK